MQLRVPNPAKASDPFTFVAILRNCWILLVIAHISLPPRFSGLHRSMNTGYREAKPRLIDKNRVKTDLWIITRREMLHRKNALPGRGARLCMVATPRFELGTKGL